MKNIFSKKLLSLLLCMVLIAATALTLASCGNEGKTDDTTVSEKSFTLVVRDLNGSEKSFTVKTDAKTVGEALLAVDMIEGEDGQYGLYVKKVNGITADYDVDQTYWAFYINGEYAMSGVDTTDIVAGATYMLAKQK